MKRYMIFYGNTYYPYGGMGDFLKDYDSLDEAKKALHEKAIKDNELANRSDIFDGKWAEIYDLQEDKIVLEY